MIRAARLIAVVVGGAALSAAVTASSSAADGDLTFNLPAAIYYVQDKSFVSPNDRNRCQVAVFADYPFIPHAKRYEIVVRLPKQNNRLMRFAAPPYEETGFTARYPPPKNFGRFSIGAYSTGDGCPAALAVTAGSAKVVSAKVTLDETFGKRFREVDKPPYKCVVPPPDKPVFVPPPGKPVRPPPGSETHNFQRPLGSHEDRMIIVRRMGTVTTTDKGSKQPVNLATNVYATEGTIVKTGPGSIVKIGALGGGSVLVGPGTTLRLTRTGFEVIERPDAAHAGFTIRPGFGGRDYKVRTCSAVMSARG